MFSKTHLALLASAVLSANGALAANHRHAQRHLHLNDKKDIVPETTTTVTDITWTTVYVDADGAAQTPSVEGAASSSSSSSSSILVSSSSSTALPTTSSVFSTSVAPTTFLTSTAAALVTPDAAVAVVETTSSTETPSPTIVDNIISDIASAATSVAAQVTSAAAAVASAVTSSSSGKRGAAYNDATLVPLLLGTGSKIGWAYNWGSSSDDLSSDLEYVPMLWGPKMVSYWASNAQAAIDAGSKYLLGPNEPDNPSQANMNPATAATFHMTNMQPFASANVKLTAPAVTNSNVAGESIDWLNEFISACTECTFSVCPVHWYNTIEAGAEDLFNFLIKAGDACGSDRTVWLTEFAPNVDNPSAAQISSFLETVQDTLDNNATFSFVERYSYFYVSEGMLISNGAVSAYGSTFAFS